MISAKKAELNLLFITAIWGLTFPLVGAAVKTVDPMVFVALRFSLAAIIMLPFVWRELKATTGLTLGYGLLIGIANLGCYWFQAVGLQTLGSGESAFITSTAVIIVPFIMLLFQSHKPKKLDFVSSLLCLAGLYILTGADLAVLNIGEFYTVLCAICCALTIILTQFATLKLPHVKLLVFYQIAFTALLALPFSASHTNEIHLNGDVCFALVYCVLFATILVFYLQAKYQKYTSAAKAALIFCAEPVFATLYSWILFSENITTNIYIGGLVILLSIAIPDILKLAMNKTQNA